MTEGFRFLSVAAGGAFQNTVPVIITLCSISLFAEPFSTPQAIGAVLVLFLWNRLVVARRIPDPSGERRWL